MAKKKTSKKSQSKKIETQVITIDLNALTVENDKFVGDIGRFLGEKIEDLSFETQGNSLKLTVAKDFSRRKIRDYLKKFLFLAELNTKYRPIALQEDGKGYKIHEKPELNY